MADRRGTALQVHALRNVTAQLPERHHRELKARWWGVFDDATSAADGRRGLQAIVADYRSAYPSAMAVIERDLDQLVAHLRWPAEHRKRIGYWHRQVIPGGFSRHL